jgi:hypothetical protein
MIRKMVLTKWSVFACFLFAMVDAIAGESPLWKEVGSWEVRVDNTLGYGCFAMAAYKGGTVLRIGFDASKNYRGYLVLGNSEWKSLEAGKEYELVVQFDRASPWSAPAQAVQFGSGRATMLFMQFDKSKVFKEFASKHQLIVFYKNQEIDRLNLKGSALAIDELVKCQIAMKETGTSSPKADPFNYSGQKRDPFAN